MSRPTQIIIDAGALLHNVARIKHFAPGKKLIAMVKANAYGCGLVKVAPILHHAVDAFGVACLDEALIIRALGISTQCILFNGVFQAEEYHLACEHQLACVIHQERQLEWLLNTPLAHPITIWIKVNTGMNRLGFQPDEVHSIIVRLKKCPWVEDQLNLMTHLACADEPLRVENQQQIALFHSIQSADIALRSIANSAAIIAFPQAHADVVRSGIMLYGVSPFAQQTGADLGLKPVMQLRSIVSTIHHLPPHCAVGYGGLWQSDKPSIIGIVPVGYGDGYPRHLTTHTPVWVNQREVLVIGRVSMDMIAIDLSEHQDVCIGDMVELWGEHIAIERVAASAGTIGYELLCQITERPRHS